MSLSVQSREGVRGRRNGKGGNTTVNIPFQLKDVRKPVRSLGSVRPDHPLGSSSDDEVPTTHRRTLESETRLSSDCPVWVIRGWVRIRSLHDPRSVTTSFVSGTGVLERDGRLSLCPSSSVVFRL